MSRRRVFWGFVVAVLLSCATSCHPARSVRVQRGSELSGFVPADLFRAANRGREVLQADGSFVVPKGVRRVWIDVGAHHLETTRAELLRYSDLLLVAIEPLAECWKEWPVSERLIGVPAAIYLEPGTMDFHVNASDSTSSLAESVPESNVAELTRTVEVRRVPVVRLRDVLAAIPPELPIAYVKTDVQGVDLEVLQSAGPELGRVYRVSAEVIRDAIYRGVAGQAPTTEAQMIEFMTGNGFRLVGDSESTERQGWSENHGWADKSFVNLRDWRLADRFLQQLRFDWSDR